MKLLCGLMALGCAPVALARNGAAIPKKRLLSLWPRSWMLQRFPLQFGRNRKRKKRPSATMATRPSSQTKKQILAEATPGGAQIHIRSWN